MTIKTRFATAIATGAVLLNALAPVALATTTVQISGNGAGSDNTAAVASTNTTVVTQNNTAEVVNTVNADADTGDNDANFNTGGDTTIGTGNASVTANVSNTLNSNSAQVDCCPQGDTDVLIEGNGAFSDNDVNLTQASIVQVTQNNAAYVNNTVDVGAETGENDANFNTGGDVTIGTGNATATVNVSTTANANVARVGGPTGAVVNPTASFRILGNGAGSDNDIVALLANAVVVDQTNAARIFNDVDVDADTGDNDANFNTGGDVTIGTGNATVDVDVDNLVNFNAAELNCGCVWDVLAKIDGNGAGFHNFGSDSDINLTLASTQVATQGNGASLNNDVNADDDAETGGNDAKFNTAGVDGSNDPSVRTGNATNTVDINNTGNVNTVGTIPLGWPWGGTQVGASFNWNAFWAFFGLSN